MSIEREILLTGKTVAIVGLSPDSNRPSYKVAAYLKSKGYIIIPVNPTADTILDVASYPTLLSVKEQVDVVDIFRRSEAVEPIIEEAIRIGAKAVWMQEGIINEKAAAKARDAGLMVVMDKCMLKEHMKINQD